MEKLKIMICGAGGAMGKMLASCIAQSEQLTVVCGFDMKTSDNTAFEIHTTLDAVGKNIDCVIDFSHYSVSQAITAFCVERGLPLVSATTGLEAEAENAIKEAAKTIPVFRSKNFSYGINVLVKLVTQAAKLLNDFDIEIIEAHHNKKVDAPSGTAQMLAEAVVSAETDDRRVVYGRYGKDCKRKKEEITVHSLRGGTIPGEHEIIFAGEDEIIKISHSALSKKVFAYGAMKAAAYITGKQNGYYTMEDMLS